jgi:hypothetical protein
MATLNAGRIYTSLTDTILNRYSDVVNATVRLGRLTIAFKTLSSTLAIQAAWQSA